ncbi:GerAB/ArcD/ProY family transporter [Paenibacillus sp. R14(2021)]|uniref:GerAB/ArcD/ProY family transporter n=1 Tax=Paenibacillus sp. R14(2021) TaxID=2859228 RepID=UPI001C615863|nr:GerAB/ArcD/ProY family transporter [Paenibacillus sp. R14(2021)]
MNQIKVSDQISPILVFFLLHVNLVNFGVLNYQRLVLKHAGLNGWISVAITGLSVHLIVWMIFKIVSRGGEAMDLVSVNRACFGRFGGKIADLIFILYFGYGALIAFRSYLSVIEVWLFPTLTLWPITLVILVLLYYTVSGGLRSVNGLSLWGTLAAAVCTFPIPIMVWSYLHPLNLLPLFNHTPGELLLASKDMSVQYAGVLSLLMIYPFLKTPGKSKKWAHGAVAAATVLYLILILVTFMYYSEYQLQLLVWPTLHIYMLLELPLFQRLEYMVISILFITVVANVAFGLWMTCRAAKQSLHIKQSVSLTLCLLLFLLGVFWIKDYDSLKSISSYHAQVGFYLQYAYVPIMFILMQFKKKSRPA